MISLPCLRELDDLTSGLLSGSMRRLHPEYGVDRRSELVSGIRFWLSCCSWLICRAHACRAQWDGGSHCGQQVTINYNGNVQVATIRDMCPGCGYGGLGEFRSYRRNGRLVVQPMLTFLPSYRSQTSRLASLPPLQVTTSDSSTRPGILGATAILPRLRLLLRRRPGGQSRLRASGPQSGRLLHPALRLPGGRAPRSTRGPRHPRHERLPAHGHLLRARSDLTRRHRRAIHHGAPRHRLRRRPRRRSYSAPVRLPTPPSRA